eukprot:GDKJ01012811.1.p1 GENE.GDKJ01012811.1~~GDKJ01012811.1.p1  ORF type:complete len:101 (-),score=1.53 GDKJ01012811.1:182-484(-)
MNTAMKFSFTFFGAEYACCSRDYLEEHFRKSCICGTVKTRSTRSDDKVVFVVIVVVVSIMHANSKQLFCALLWGSTYHSHSNTRRDFGRNKTCYRRKKWA